MKRFYGILACVVWSLLMCTLHAGTPENCKVLVLTERGGQHGEFTDAALKWLDGFARVHGFAVTEVHNTELIDREFLAQYKVFVQLDYPPYNWTDKAKAAFEQAIFDGTVGWVGFHHAALLGDFDGFPMWHWFSDYSHTDYTVWCGSCVCRCDDSTVQY